MLNAYSGSDVVSGRFIAVIREALLHIRLHTIVGNLVKQKRISIYFQELTCAIRQRSLYSWHVFTIYFSLWAKNLHRGVWRLKASKSSHHSHVYNVLQRTAGLPVLCVCLTLL